MAWSKSFVGGPADKVTKAENAAQVLVTSALAQGGHPTVRFRGR